MANTPFRDPRDIITPHAFQLDARLLGLPLAMPSRRAVAIAVDGILVSLMAQAGGVVLALVAAVMFSAMLKNRHASANGAKRALLVPLRIIGALMIFGLVAAIVQPLWEKYAPKENQDTSVNRSGVHVVGDKDIGLPGQDLGEFIRHNISLQQCEDGICRLQKIEALAGLMKKSTLPDYEKRKVLVDLAKDAAGDIREQVALAKVINQRLDLPEASKAEEVDEAAATDADSTEIQVLRAQLAEQEHANSKLSEQLESLRAQANGFSVLKTLQNLGQELGFGVGWAAVYFTLFTSWWNGQTPGKRLLGIRVVHLNSKPLSLWETFSRFGGYSAGFATGLLGFLQCFWDANRQAIHDKIAFTAVIRDVDGKTLERAYAEGDAHFGDFLDKLEDAGGGGAGTAAGSPPL